MCSHMLTSHSQGTWQFLSIGLLKDPKKPHTLLDDLESFLWVLTYMGLHYLKHTFRGVIEMFDEYRSAGSGGALGGSLKKDFLGGSTGKFASEPFQRLVASFSDVFDQYYVEQNKKIKGKTNDFDEYHQRLINDPSEILGYFDAALASTGWEDNDRLDKDNYPQVTQAVELKQVRKSQQSSSFRSSMKMGTSSARQGASGSIPHLPPTAGSDFHSRCSKARDPFEDGLDPHLSNTPGPTPSPASTSSKCSLSRSGTEVDEPEAEKPKKKKRKTTRGSVRSGDMPPPVTPRLGKGLRRSSRLAAKANAPPALPQGSAAQPKQARRRKRSRR